MNNGVYYRLFECSDEKKSRHHIVPKSRGGSNAGRNIVIIADDVHKAFHKVFENKTPPEQIKTMMNINGHALSCEFQNDISRILEMARDSQYVYKDGVLVTQ